jgi:putative iron-regulated protein
MSAMKRIPKMWTGLGVAAIAGSMAAQADVITLQSAANQSPIILAQEAGEGGEGGGEGGGGAPTTYALESTDANAFKYDAKPQIDAYIDLVASSYKKAADDAKTLAAAVDAFLAAPSDDTLKVARAAWVAARPAYLKTEAFRFYDGPIEEVEGAINAWPMNEAYIDYVEGKPDAGLINDASFKVGLEDIEKSNQSKDEADVTTGWHAIEFLLWGQDLSADGPGNRPFTDYVAGSGNNDRRREYLKLVTDELAHELHELEGTWQLQNAAGYAKKLKAMPEREVIGRMVNGMAILAGFEFMSERLAVALDSGDQEDEHSCFSDTTKQDFVYDLVGIKQVWTGDNEGGERAGLNDLVRSLDAGLADRVDGLLADAETKVAVLGDPWDQVLATPKDSPERKAAEDVVVALQALGTGLKDAGSKLGVLVLIPTE